jgi:hypothetical protein
MDSDQYSKFTNIVQSLELGDPIEAITNRLGLPSIDQVLATKEEGRFVCRWIRYDVVRYREDEVNDVRDRYVVFVLDENNNVREIKCHCKGMTNRPASALPLVSPELRDPRD